MNHVLWLLEDFPSLLEVPFLDCLLVLDFCLGVLKLLSPFCKDLDTLTDQFDGLIWIFHLENGLNVDFSFDLFTYLS